MSPSKQAATESRQFKFPDSFTEILEKQLKELGHTLAKPGELARAVKQLSDYYIDNPTLSTPWHKPWAQAAYLAYFFPLNYLRTEAVFQELNRVGFFEGLDRFIDFGCGLSSVPFLAKKTSLRQGVGIDKSLEVLQLLESLLEKTDFRMRLYKDFNGVFDPDKEVGIFSYVLTETRKLPAWAIELEALVIIEPSTREDGRYLLDLRDALIEEGYLAWAPCTHQKPCPLFNKSAKDWCHDRISVDLPQWYADIEKHLPMKNRTITYSYVAVRQAEPKPMQGLARSVGDVLDENGKYREMICRGEEREFLAWLKKEHPEAPGLLRGQLFELPKSFEKKADEIRVPPGKEILPLKS